MERENGCANGLTSSALISCEEYEHLTQNLGNRWSRTLQISSKTHAQPMRDNWHAQRVPSRLKQIWKTIPLCISWTIWLERNKALFEGHRDHISRVKNKCGSVLLV
ncbi:hypothetical protein H5410_017409 [Solanum commersonii]|uniref:Uncharacterized protein n=1 Tax=Solanum commersonii TaxID=4109 RepID=A0A9J5ZZ73_SOLCO|nr:hypothetical protein H5410_017409 [Solanum commersonii]